MSSSEVQICDRALLKFGDITTGGSILSPTNKQGRACKVLYPQLRDELMAELEWNFAIDRADISAQLTDTPDFQWDHAYTVPVDCLRVVQLYGTKALWQVEDGKLLTNQSEEIYIRYIKRVTTTGRFSPSFINCLVLRLAAELAPKLGGTKTMRAEFIEELEKIALPKAYRLNSIEGNRELPEGEQALDHGNYSWQKEGHDYYSEILNDPWRN